MRNKFSKIALAATLGLAITFTLSCSGSDDGSSTLSPCTGGTVRLGSQVWQKCNSNAMPSAGNSRCYDDKESNCAIYGRLYDWDAAKSACPSGFHLPTAEEWDILVDYAGGRSVAGRYLKASSGWSSGGNGEDKYGFSALPGGYDRRSGGSFGNVGSYGYWWSASESYSNNAYYRYMSYSNEYVNYFNDVEFILLSVRCLQD